MECPGCSICTAVGVGAAEGVVPWDPGPGEAWHLEDPAAENWDLGMGIGEEDPWAGDQEAADFLFAS